MPEEPMYLTWSNEEERRQAFASFSQKASEIQPIVRTVAFDTFKNIRPNTSVRDSFMREDYEYFRHNEAIPKGDKEILEACGSVYERVGLIQNIVNLMADFTVQGIRLRHENARIQDFYDEWARRVGFAERSERMANFLYRYAVAPVLKATAKLKPSKVKEFYSGFAAGDLEIQPDDDFGNREIPWRYTILDPVSLDVVGGDLALFTNKMHYAIRLDERLIDRIKNPKTDIDKDLVKHIPDYIKGALKKGEKSIPLPDDRLDVLFFKKDDTQVWPRPITYAILSDIMILEKMKLADLAALDGAISHIRIWKLGDIKEHMLPSPAAIDRLRNILLANVGGGVMDLVWGPDLQLDTTSTEIQKYLASEKYDGVLGRIYSGMGIPETLSGKSSSGGFTNNFISMKTLTERLNYGRTVLNKFWEKELRLIAKSMKFSAPPHIVYDRMTLSDEAAEQAILLQLIDRDIISVETAQELFDQIPELEQARISKEHKMRDKEKFPQKAGPWHNPQQKNKYIETLVQQGVVTPSQVGLQLDDPTPNEERLVDLQMKMKKEEMKMKGQPQQGRPKNSKDSSKRKQKRVVPRSKAFLTTLAWANEAQKQLADKLNTVYLKIVKSKNLRTLTNAQVAELENFKFGVFLKLPVFSEVTDDLIGTVLESSVNIPLDAAELKSNLLGQLRENTKKQATMDDARNIQAVVYAYMNMENVDVEDISDD